MMCSLLLIAIGAGCRSRSQNMDDLPPPTTRPVEVIQKPAIDLARGGAGFPLDVVTAPTTIEQLVDALTRSYQARLEADPMIGVLAVGNTIGELKSLEIDITGSTVKSSFTPTGPAKSVPAARPFMRVGQLTYRADPLKYATYDASMTLQATNARLALLPAADKKLSLVLYDCREGSARISVALDHLEKGLTAAMRIRGGMALKLRSVEMRMRSASAHNLEADFTVHAHMLMVPTTFRLVGRADVDSNFNIHFTSLAAEGNDPSGAVIAAFIQGKLDKLNNKAAPLLKLPGDKIHITDLSLKLDDRLTVEVKFAGTQ